MKNLYYLILSVFCIYISPAKAQDNYRTLASGNWNSTSLWEKDNNGNGIFSSTATSPTSTAGLITVRGGHNLRIISPVSIDQTIVEVGATVNISSGSNLTVLNGTGTDLTINGVLNDSGTLTISNSPTLALVNINGTLNNIGVIANASATSLTFGTNSVYNHQFTTTAGAIPIASWNITSTCKITGYTTNTTPPTGLNQTFGNFEWNTPYLDISNYFYLDGEPSTVLGDFRIKDAGSIAASSGIMFNSLNLSKTINIGDTFEITNDAYVSLNESGTGITNINTKHFLLTGSNTYLDLADLGIGKLNISGNYTATNGNIQLSSNNANAGVFFKPQIPYRSQIFTNNTIPASPLNYTVDSIASLYIPNGSFIGGTGALNVLSGGEISLGSLETSGAIQSGTTGGNIRMSTRNFSFGSKLIFNGTSQQYFGGGFPLNAKIIVRNNNGVKLQSNAILLSTLRLDSGSLNLNGYNLTIGNNQTILGQVETNNGYLTGSGTLTRWFDTTNVLVGSNSGLFPFATHSDTTRFLWISGKPNTGGTISVSYQNANGTTVINPAFNDNGTLVNIRNNFNWTVNTGSGISGNLGLKIRVGKSGGVADLTNLRISLINGIAPGIALNGSGMLTEAEASRTSISTNNLNQTYYLAANASQNPLPIKFLNFYAELSNKILASKWMVAQEKNIKEYRIMLSTDFKNWELLDKVTNIKNSSANHQYQKEIFTNYTHFYLQLVAIDLNDLHTYSEIINIGNENAAIQINIYPNPISKGDIVNVESEFGIKKITLLSPLGNELVSKEVVDEANTYQLNTDGITSGTYFLKIITNQDIIIKRIQIK